MRATLLLTLLLVNVLIVYSQDDEQPAKAVNCAAAAKVDEFEYTTLKAARERLDLFGLQIKNSDGLGVIIGYGGKSTEGGEGRNIAYEASQYVAQKYDLDAYSVVASREGGHRETKTLELFIKYSTCGEDPVPTPSLKIDDVTYKEEVTFFGKNVVKKDSAELRALITEEIDPIFPPAARAVHASGTVLVLVLVDENGQVVKASAVDGHPLLKIAAENTVKRYTFQKLRLNDQSVRYGGKIELDFTSLLQKLDNHN
ncbi:MAG: energy transducer TonB [Acidobacteria bacterium]|nr:energy transducer TonB [Acidobacteriota bacterium]